MTRIIFFLLLSLSSKQSLSEENIVILKTKRRSHFQNSSLSNSTVLKNESILDKNLKEHIKDKSSLSREKSFEISENDFYIPKIRGQKTGNTELWLNEGLIYDPWISLPMSYCFNPKSFNSLTINEGQSPYHIPSLNPFGLIQYKKSTYKDKTKIGLKVGDYYGEGLWGNIERKNIITKHFHSGVLFSLHQTEGSYRYYDDAGTPFTEKNSSYKNLKRNEQKSFLINPYLSLEFKKIKIQIYTFIYKKNRNTPNLIQQESQSDTSNLTFLNQLDTHIFLKKNQSLSIIPNKLSMIFNHQQGWKNLNKPESKEENVSRSLRFALNSLWYFSALNIKSSFAYGSSQTDTFKRDQKVQKKRHYYGLYLGSKTKFKSDFNFQKKIQARFSNSKKKLISFSYSLSLFYKKDKSHLYFQVSETKRLANMLEELGDGNFIEASPELKSEKNTHFELGFLFKSTHTLSANVFLDLGYDKISFFPASFKKFKALNLHKSKTIGTEFSHHYGGTFLEIYTGLSLIENIDISTIEKKFYLPNSPFYIITNSTKLLLNRYYFLIHNRLKGHYYNDLANTIRVAPSLISGFSFGANFKRKKSSFSLRIDLDNILDLMTLNIETTGSRRRSGKIARNEIYGFPLPGRTISLSLEASI